MSKLNHKTLEIVLPMPMFKKLEDMAKRRKLEIDDFIRISLRTVSRRTKFFDIGDKLNFGKYEDEPIETIIRADPTYIVWLARNIEGFLISDKAEELLIEILHIEQIEIGPNLYKNGE